MNPIERITQALVSARRTTMQYWEIDRGRKLAALQFEGRDLLYIALSNLAVTQDRDFGGSTRQTIELDFELPIVRGGAEPAFDRGIATISGHGIACESMEVQTRMEADFNRGLGLYFVRLTICPIEWGFDVESDIYRFTVPVTATHRPVLFSEVATRSLIASFSPLEQELARQAQERQIEQLRSHFRDVHLTAPIPELFSAPQSAYPGESKKAPPSCCDGCAYFMKGINAGEIDICNAFHNLELLSEATSCDDFQLVSD